MLKDLHTLTPYLDFIRTCNADPDYRDPMLLTQQQLHRNLLDAPENPNTRVFGTFEGEAITGVFALLVLEDERYQFEAVTENLHTTLLERCTLTFSDPRVIDTINGCDALAWYREQRAALGFGETDFEHVTLTDPLGVNAHLSCEGGKLVSGRDLCPQMTLRLAKPDTVLPRMQAFYDDPDALIFGCAGLKGILPAELHSPGLGLFLFGEVCTVNGQAEFGNLMLSKLRITKR